MRRVLITLTILLSTFAAKADEAAIQNVITSQVEAFQADDFDGAFTYASPTIKRLFGSPETFGRMVKQGYPMVWRPVNVEYLELKEQGEGFVQNVLFTDQQGALHIIAYDLITTPDGWQINAVRLLKAPELGV